MTFEVGTNTYISVAEADDFHATRGNTAWANISDDATKEQLLVRATDFLENSYCFVGQRATSEQDLSWPREGVYDDRGDRITDVPQGIKHFVATMGAVAISTPSLSTSPDPAIKSIREKIGPLDEEIVYRDSSAPRPRFPEAEKFLKGLIVAATGIDTITLLRG